MPPQTQTRRIIIKVDTADSKGLKEIADKMGYLNKSTKSLAGNMSFLTNAFTGFLGYLGVREIARMADEMQNLNNRLKITTAAGQSTSDVFQQLADLADRTAQPIAAVGDAYNRLALSLSAVKPRTGELIALSETLINSFRVAGATTTETANTMIQLGQAFSSGELRGQELRSVMEQNGVLAKILREEFGTDVYKKAEKGLIGVKDVLTVLAANFEKINEQSKKLAPTFDQTLTKAMNKLSIAIGEVNEKFGLSAKFADAMSLAIDNLLPLVVTLATVGIATLIAKLGALQLAANAFLASNPYIAAFTAIIIVGTALFTNFDRIAIAVDNFRASANDLGADLAEKLIPLLEKLSPNKDKVDLTFGLKEKIAALRAESKLIRDNALERESFQLNEDKRLDKLRAKELKALAERYKAKPGKGPTLKEELAELNQEFLKTGNIDAYNKKIVDFQLHKLNKEFKLGKINLDQYNKGLREINLQKLNRQLREGVVSIQDFQTIVRNDAISQLDAKFKQGTISLIEYHTQLVKISDQFLPGSALIAGTASYIESIGTLSSNIADGITKTFNHLEDNLVEFIKTGEFNFKKFTQSILDDLTRIIVRASITKPLADAILNIGVASAGSSAGSVGNAGGGANTTTAATGRAFYNGNLQKFAKGGIVNSPTTFSYGRGGRGLMGEAGSEAIIPLQRAGNGDLGVAASVTPVNINIINQSGATVEQRESTGPSGEKNIDILIVTKVREGIINGRFDTAMKQNYGLSRRGS